MKKYVSPEVELLALEAQEVIMASDDEELEKDDITVAELVVREI